MPHDDSVDSLSRNPSDEIPSIQVTDNSSTPRLSAQPPLDSDNAIDLQPGQQHARSQSEHGLLAPIPILRSGRTSLDVPNSPTGSSWGSDGSTHVPPSPTLSTHSSVQFAPPTTLALRENTPGTGLSSLHLLSPSNGNGHGRKSSVASSADGSNDGTEPDSHSIGMNTLALSPSPTHTQYETSSVGGTTVHERSPSRSQDRQKTADAEGDADAQAAQGEPEQERPALDLEQDAEIDPRPFAYKPFHLASLVDPKSLETLTKMGGVEGLLKGLGTHRKHGLSKFAIAPPEQGHALHNGAAKVSGQPATEGKGESQRHDRSDVEAVPGIVVTGDDGKAEQAALDGLEADSGDKGEAYAATLEDRHRVFGENVLPTRKTKSLLQLMWLAMKDKVLVRNTAFVQIWNSDNDPL